MVSENIVIHRTVGRTIFRQHRKGGKSAPDLILPAAVLFAIRPPEAAAKPVAIEKSASHWDELRAYRRAETVERQARDRVNELYTGANTALRGAGATLRDTNAAFEALAEKFRADLVELMNAIDTGKNALSAAADTLDGLRPEDME